MKVGWETWPFKECIERVTYTSKIQRKDFQQTERFPIVSQEEAPINGYWDNPSDLFQVARPVVIFGDHTKCFKYVDFDFVLGADGVKILKPIKKLDPEFFYYQLCSIKLEALGYARHYRLLKQAEIYAPPLDEQRRIVEVLDKAFAGIATATANVQKNLTNACSVFENYAHSTFANMVETEPAVSLKRLTQLITKGSSPKWQGIVYVDEPGVLFVTSENVGSYELKLDRPKYVELEFNKKDRKSILQNGDVLTNIVGASIGRTAIYNIHELANINQAVCLIRCNSDVLSNRYLTHLLNCPQFLEILHSNEVNSARANLSLGFFSQLEIPCPSLHIQTKISDRLDEFRDNVIKLIDLQNLKFATLTELKQSLLQKAFAGELT